MKVDDALRQRRSIREFLDTEVTQQQVCDLLDAARWSPSGGNLQPWKVIVVSGQAKQHVSQLALSVLSDNPAGEGDAYPVYPYKLWEPYRTRRYELGEAMYALLGIPREDKAARIERMLRNYEFFGAPVGLFFAIDRGMGHGQWAHLGMFMQSLALIAVEHGLATCMQESWGMVRRSLAKHFALPDDQVIYCGMALGYANNDHPVNQLHPQRTEVATFTQFHGFPPPTPNRDGPA